MDREEQLRAADKRHLWHPFTQMRGWIESDEDPLILDRGDGPWLFDLDGNRYFDGNSSIWTNIHGHCHPKIVEAIQGQVAKLDHCSALGFSNESAIRLAEKLVEVAPGETLSRVFLSDDGSTAIECACKAAVQFRQLTDSPERDTFLAFDGAYHGDTIGAASLGRIGAFNDRFASTGYRVRHVADYSEVEALEQVERDRINAVVIEPLIRGAGGMKTWPTGMLRKLREWCDETGSLLILDEVMTGFGRTGRLFACEHENVVPDFLCLAKGLTGGTLPLAATLTTEAVFEAFLGEYEELKTFFYGHSYCGNPIACAAALANLEIFEEDKVLDGVPAKTAALGDALSAGRTVCPYWGQIRQVGLIAGIDLQSPDGSPLDWREETGARVCRAARKHGLLTRPVRDTLTLMPPLCASEGQIEEAAEALRLATLEVLGEA
ncbi:MAG: adenosylmethionine--8-amino-7-oxononanoate transaminase [Verrucomicrobiota bacterium]